MVIKQLLFPDYLTERKVSGNHVKYYFIFRKSLGNDLLVYKTEKKYIVKK